MILRSFTPLALLLALAVACSDGNSGRVVAIDDNPAPPVGTGDGDVFDPPDGGSGGEDPPDTTGTGQSGTGGTGAGTGGTGGGTGGGGAPVPEPATMFLVGTGLAGAALYRRRRRAALAS